MSTHQDEHPPPGDTGAVTGVVVGDDSTRHSVRVIELAQDEADRLDLPLTILAVTRPAADPDLSMSAQLRDEHAATAESRRGLASSVARAHVRRPGGVVTGVSLADPSEAQLADALSGAALLVVGSRGPAGHRVFSLGTTSRQLLHAARCQLLVIPVDGAAAPPRRTGLVVAGVDDTPSGPEVIRAAVAAATSGHVQLLHSYHRRQGETSEQALARARATCDLQVQRAALEQRIHLTRVLTPEPAAAALVRQTGGAALVVIGTRGALALAGLAHDSVSRAVVSAMPCPVLVVPRPVTPRAVSLPSQAQVSAAEMVGG